MWGEGREGRSGEGLTVPIAAHRGGGESCTREDAFTRMNVRVPR